MPKTQLRDIVVILPGIGGSVLQQDGRDIWNYSSQSILQLVKTLGRSLYRLKLPRDVSMAEDFDDGIRATSLVQGAHIVPGLEKVLKGYHYTSQRIKDNFNLIEGNIFDNKPANFYEFPYDWRIDNRINAQRLKTFLDRQLPIWREHTGLKDAKVILLAHSMGGLISRHYLEVLEGWVDCKALFTFGTPYGGSIDAIDFLANSQKLFKLVEVTDIIRSFPSVYQLLPRRPVLKIGNSYQSIAEATIPLPNINPNMALDAKKFHDEIEAAVKRHFDDAKYPRFYTTPFVGIKQTTNQSAQLADGKITVSTNELHQGIDFIYGDGDGIVPYWSAIPQEFSDEYRETYIAEKHGAIQSNPQVLTQVHHLIKRMQNPGSEPHRGPEVSPNRADEAAISLSVDDLYQSGEAITIRAQLKDTQRDFGGIEAEIQLLADDESSSQQSSPQLLQLNQTGDLWSVETGDLKPGVYQVKVETVKTPQGAPKPVRDVFEVI